MNRLTEIYEVVDATNDESYYTLGLFQSFDEAKRALMRLAANCDSAISDYADDYELIEIRSRPVGELSATDWSILFTLERNYEYSETEDDHLWRIAE